MRVFQRTRGSEYVELIRAAIPERHEDVRFTIDLTADQYHRVYDILRDLKGEDFDFRVSRGDTVLVTYDFTIEYYRVVKQLRAIQRLMEDPTIVVDVNLEERQGMTILLVELVDAIRDLQRTLVAQEGETS